jgi:hypothetical protein
VHISGTGTEKGRMQPLRKHSDARWCQRLTSFLWIVSVCSFKINHLGRHSQLAKPSSLTLTIPFLTISESLSGIRLGEPPIPEYEGAYDELMGEKDALYPVAESELLLYRMGLGACGAGREGVNEVAVTWWKAMMRCGVS